MANDELREIFNETMESIISEWLEEGLSEKEISEKLSMETIDLYYTLCYTYKVFYCRLCQKA